MRVVQRFSDEYLGSARRIPPAEVVRFLEEFRLLHTPGRKSRLISMKIPESLLTAFRLRCRAEGVRYQTRIKQLMLEWLDGTSPGRRKRGR